MDALFALLRPCCSSVASADKQRLSSNGVGTPYKYPVDGSGNPLDASDPVPTQVHSTKKQETSPASFGDEVFESRVNELQKLSDLANGKSSCKSEMEDGQDFNPDQSDIGSVADSERPSQDGLSERLDGMSAKEQRREAKVVIKEFVKEMVKGKKMNVMATSGQLRSCAVSLSRKLDVIKIKVGHQVRKVPLSDVDEIHSGTEPADIDTPLDELCATLALLSGECITFRFPDVVQRDTFVMCLLMFANAVSG